MVLADNPTERTGPASAGEVAGEPRHVAALDGMRGVAFLMVFCFHVTTGEAGGAPATGAAGLLLRIAGFGWAGVDLFFVLSGYLITGVLLGERESPHYYRNFYARRALRIFPVYYLAVAAALLLVPALKLNGSGTGYPWTVQIWFWLNLSNLLTAFSPLAVVGLTHFWSLAIEEQFYLVWPGLVRQVSERRLFQVAAGLLVLASVARNLPIVVRLTELYPNFTYRMTPLHCDGLLLGAMLAVLMRSGRLRRWRLLPAVPAVIGLGVAGLLHWGSERLVTALVLRWSFLVAGVFFASVLALVLVRGPRYWVSRVFSVRVLRWVGSLSYCLYVVHLTGLHMGAVLAEHLPGLSGGALKMTEAALGLAVSLVVAMVSRVAVEQPALRLKRYFR